MLLKSITLKNFRQFKDITLDFSTDNEKNVTIVIGDNGSGKTTLLQAFFWCLYGSVSFNDKDLFNKEDFKRLGINQSINVEVIIHLIHSNTEYSISRLIHYKKNDIEQAKAESQKFEIKKKTAEGKWFYLSTELDKKIEVDKILPKYLSNYFFFAGERIETMSRELIKGRKNADFKTAIMGLTGLNALIKAREHLDSKRSKASVKSKFESEYNDSANNDIKKLTEEINYLKRKIDENNLQKERLKDNIEEAREQYETASLEIREHEDGRRYQLEKDNLEKTLSNQIRLKNMFIDNIFSEFQNNRANFFSRNLVKDALNIIQNFDFSGKNIPDISSKTLEYLLSKGTCLCGSCLSEGSNAYNTINNLFQYIPPQSIGNTVSNFIKDTKQQYLNKNNLYEELKKIMVSIKKSSDEIINIENQIVNISNKLLSEDLNTYVNNLQKLVNNSKLTISKNEKELENINMNIGSIESDIKLKETRRNQLVALDKTNHLTGMCIAYTEAIYELLDREYQAKEDIIKHKLKAYINDIFLSIFDGEISLTIDDNYNIDIIINKYKEGIEISTAQSVSVIFAFIASIIKIARENSNTEDDETIAEPYPLVMDAPWSVFDKDRIEAITRFIPEIAQQVIIFIKNTDGDIAINSLDPKIGKKYTLAKLNDFETVVKGE